MIYRYPFGFSFCVVEYFLFSFSGNLLLLPVREEVWKGKFYLRLCASTLI